MEEYESGKIFLIVILQRFLFQECTNVFSTGGGESLAEVTQTTFLGRIPLDNYISTLEGSGKSVVDLHPHKEVSTALDSIVDNLLAHFDSSSSEYR